MTEELISFETAKLAKEKGFDGYCYDCFNSYGCLNSNGWCEYIQDNDTILPFKSSALKKEDFLRPTQSLLQKWLREVHEIEVNPAQSFTKGGIKMQYNISVESYKYNHLGKYIYGNTYEEALEIGLQEALKLIKI